MESFERKSTINNVVGGNKEIQIDTLDFYQKEFNEQKIFTHEIQKSQEVIKSIEAIVSHLNDFVLKYGGKPLDVKPDFIHFIDASKDPGSDEPFVVESARGHFDQALQNILIKIEDGDTFLFVIYKIVHELLHAYSFNSVLNQVITTEDEQEILTKITTRTRRVGISIDTSDSRKRYFEELNEAITVELEKMFSKTYFKDIPEIQKDFDLKERKVAWLREHRPDHDEYEDVRDILITPNEDGETSTWQYKRFSYIAERKNLNAMIDDILEISHQFMSREEVFDVFARAYMSGRLLPMVRLINETYQNRPIPGIETEETLKAREGKMPFSVIAEATVSN